MRAIDVSRTIHDKMRVYPGNPATKVTVLRKASKNSSELALLSMGCHNGTHVDSPRHIDASGAAVDRIPLQKLYGKAVVLDFRGSDSISEGMMKRSKGVSRGVIVLLKTRNSSSAATRFKPDFAFVEGGAAKYLAKAGVKAVGVDGPSIDKFHSGSHPAHSELLSRGIPIIEGLDLSDATAGKCEFYCFPLKIADCDSAPARAVIIA